MIQFLKNSFNKINNFIEKSKVIARLLTLTFDYVSQFTHFFLFNIIGFLSFMSLLFVIPVTHSQDFINFLINLSSNPFHFLSFFQLLPLGLKLVLSFYFFLIECVILCTFLSFLPIVKKEMVIKYCDENIIKKRGYNMWSSSLRRVTVSGVPLTAAIIVAGDVTSLDKQIQGILENNNKVWKQ